MRLKESDIQKKGRRWPAIQEPDSRRRYMHRACILVRKYFVVPDRLGNLRHVLQPRQYRGIASRFERMHNVLLVVIQRKAAMGKSKHAAAVGMSPVSKAARLGEHVGAALKAFRNRMPSCASRCKFGVGTDWP